MPSSVEVEDSESDAKGGNNASSLSNQLNGPQDDKANGSEEEEKNVDMLLDAAGSEPKAKCNVGSRIEPEIGPLHQPHASPL